jgi:hypothetical protein
MPVLGTGGTINGILDSGAVAPTSSPAARLQGQLQTGAVAGIYLARQTHGSSC